MASLDMTGHGEPGHDWTWLAWTFRGSPPDIY